MIKLRKMLLAIVALATVVAMASPFGNAADDVVRFDFETGDLQGWQVVEGEFGTLICDRAKTRNQPGLDFLKQGKYFLTTLESKDMQSHDAYTGVLESPVFVLEGPEMSLLVGGGKHRDVCVALCTLNGKEVLQARGVNHETGKRITWKAPKLVGKKVFLRVRDGHAGGWGHISLDDFQARGRIDEAATRKRFAGADRRRLAQKFEAVSGGRPAALRAAIEDLSAIFPRRYPRGAEFMKRLTDLEKRTAELTAAIEKGQKPESSEEMLREFDALYREALLANPLLTDQPILFVVREQYRKDHHNTATIFQTGEVNTGSFRGGGALKTIDLKTGKVQTLLELADGMVRDPEVSFDGHKIVFSLRQNIQDNYHIYEMNADGSGQRALTAAAGVADIDPLYLPGGDIVFSSTREPKYCMCNQHIMANLFRMDGDGANIHQLGKSTLFEGHGALLPDGRILYDRWEYVDRNFGDAQGLWVVNPDGTNHCIFWGNNTGAPGGVIDARAIPGSERIVAILGSCHDRPWGALGIIDRRLGLDGRTPVVHTWPPDAVERVDANRNNSWDAFMSLGVKYEDPYPLCDLRTLTGAGKYFLCARTLGKGEVTGIYLIDVFGNETLVHTEGGGCWDPMPLGPRLRPAAIPNRRDFESEKGYFYIVDAYKGTHMEGVAPGAVKYLRVIESPEKRFFTNPSWGGQGVHKPAMNWHGFENKRILGTVPVETDGSAHFAVPSGKFVYFQLLDENKMSIQSMRSGTLVQPGERQGCVGCHENRRTAPPAGGSKMALALRREPSQLDGWHGPPRLFNYMTEVQPVWDKHCVSCHDYGKKGAEKLILAGDRTLTFNASYNELWRKKYIKSIGAGPAQIQQPYVWGANASKLVQHLRATPDDNHKDVKLDPESFERIVTWIDVNAPFYPEYASAYPDNLAGRSPLDGGQVKRLTELTGVNFNGLANHNRKAGPQVSFDRPALSPCLVSLKEKDAAKYQEALAIIEVGKQTLAARPRADMAGFQPAAPDAARGAKYLARQEAEQRSLAAIRGGVQTYDPKRE